MTRCKQFKSSTSSQLHHFQIILIHFPLQSQNQRQTSHHITMATMEDYKYLFKVVLVGNAGVGKTCLVRRFTQGMFPPGQGATIGVDFMIKTVEVDGEKIKVGSKMAGLAQWWYSF